MVAIVAVMLVPVVAHGTIIADMAGGPASLA